MLGLGLALLAATWAHALLGFGGAAAEDLFASWIYDGLVFLSIGVLVLAPRQSGRAALPWRVLAAGLLLHGIGDIIYSTSPDLGAVPVPSVSDPLWLAIFPCAYVALLVLIRQRVGRTLLATRLDGVVSGLAAASLLASVSLPLALDATAGTSFWETATNLSYTIGDLILLGLIVSAIALAGWRVDRIWLMLAAAIVAWETADLIYLFDPSAAILARSADALVSSGTLVVAFAAYCDGGRAERWDGRGRGLLLPVAFGVLALGVLAVGVPLHVNPAAGGLAAAALLLALGRMGLALSENERLLRESRVEAATDPLTGLPNRRSMTSDLNRLEHEDAAVTHALVLLDLNGFKGYNDSYGHVAGDALLVRLGAALAAGVGPLGTAYRMGGDEFCVLGECPAGEVEAFARCCADALATSGRGFSITAAYGAVLVPDECSQASAALTLADTRMYRQKRSGRPTAASQSANVLMAVVEERAPELADHVRSVSELACATGVELDLDPGELEALRHASALHDVGKMAIPSSVLQKPGALSPDEWELIRRHPIIGERIIGTAPALQRSARLVRSSHERIDGQGYPDGLSGGDIPLGARIICATDAFEAMTSERPYGRTLSQAAALAELRRCAGTQFDPDVVAALARAVKDRGPAGATTDVAAGGGASFVVRGAVRTA